MALGGLAGTAAKLLASLDLDTRPFEKGAGRVDKSLGKMEGRFGKIGKAAAVGLGAAAAGAAVVVGKNVKSGLESLADLEDAQTQVQGALEQTGLTGRITAQQVADAANRIEASVEAAFDDKDITRATGSLLRFGKLTPQNLEPAMQVMTDLATKTGSVDSAAQLLGKALADPEKAAGKLARTGVILTKEQQKQIKEFMKANDLASAQGVILDSLAETTGGAAKALHGPYRDSMLILQDVTEDAQRALATGFLPVIMKVRDMLSKELAKPETLARIREFGEGLAGGVDSLINLATGLPWQQIGDAMKLTGQGAKAALDLFTGLPPWVQTAVLTGWGLNKLTGGALGGIVGELGKGLIKGVLGMNAGVVNARAGVVNVSGAGGAAGAAGAAGGGKGGGLIGGAVGIGSLLLVIDGISKLGPAIDGTLQTINSALSGDKAGAREGLRQAAANGALSPSMAEKMIAASFEKNIGHLGEVTLKVRPVGMSPDERQELSDQRDSLRTLRKYGKSEAQRDHVNWSKMHAKQDRLAHKAEAQRTAVERAKGAIDWSRRATTSKLDDVAATERHGAERIVNAIRANRARITVVVNGRTLGTARTRTGQTVVRTGLGGQALL